MIFSDRYALTAGRDFASSILGSFASPTDKMSTEIEIIILMQLK